MIEPVHWQEELRGRSPSSAEYAGLARSIHERPEGLHPVHLTVLSTWTTQLLTPHFTVEGARRGLHVNTHLGPFGQFEQALLADNLAGSAESDEALLLAMRLEDVDPDAIHRFHSGGPAAFDALADDVVGRLERTVGLFRQRSNGPVLVANFAAPAPGPLGVFDSGAADSLTHCIHALNRRIAGHFSATDVAIWDYAGLVASRGSEAWTDPRLWALARLPVAASHHGTLAAHLMRTLSGLLHAPAKCLVLDADNTLWGGVIGDDGLGGIQLGDDHPGRAFKEFQRAALSLRDRGIVLALASRNDPDVVEAAFREHPEMVLKWSDFSETRIHWGPKSESLRQIAAALNLGLDSLVFFDDNPVERAEVRHAVPDVQVVDVPTDPTLFVRVLQSTPHFDTGHVTSEDRGRADSYRAEASRRNRRETADTLEDFLESLEMEAHIGALDETSSSRVAQLVAKTNQFNLTTQRQSQSELEALHALDEGLGVFWLRLRDRYGDMGLVAVGVLVAEAGSACIQNLVMSCRVANRGVEQAMLAYLIERARTAGYDQVIGDFVPSARNHVVAELYPSAGFEVMSTSGDTVRYTFDLTTRDLPTPTSIRVQTD